MKTPNASLRWTAPGDASAEPERRRKAAPAGRRAPKRQVLVCHPGLQHSHQLALALHERGLLQAFWSGVPVAEPGAPLPWWMPSYYRERMRRVAIPAALRTHPLRFQLWMQGAARLGIDLSGDQIHRMFHRFDRWAAARVRRLRPAVVIAYENAAYETFAAAKAVGARCILDAAAFHHRAVAQLVQSENTPYTQEVNRRKDGEIALADLILTCSPVAADSYLQNGVPAQRLRPLLLGATVQSDRAAVLTRAPGVARFLFAGPLSRRKSVDLIIAALRRLQAEGLPCRIDFVGGVAEPDLLELIHATPQAQHHASLPQRELANWMAAADCLLLPSRSDSFGMVVAEAMACGTPALVSTQTGAKAIIDLCPEAGWIVAPTEAAIHDQMQRLLRDPAQLLRARPAAVQAAQTFTWERYRARAGQAIEEFIA